MNHTEINSEYLGEPGQIRRFRTRCQQGRMFIMEAQDEHRILDSMYMKILKDLVDKGMFTVNYEENMDGSVLFEITLDVRSPLDYGTPRWETIKKKNGI